MLLERDESSDPFSFIDFYHELSQDPEYFIFSQSDTKPSSQFPKQLNLYRQRYSDGETVQLNTPKISGGNVTSFKVSDDGRFLVYSGDQLSDDRFELFAIEYRQAVNSDDESLCFPVLSSNGSTSVICL